jgi:hypothetical protein
VTKEHVTAAIERSLHCVDCGTGLDAVTRLSVAGLAGRPPVAPFCRPCADKRAPGIEWREAPCEHCERPVRRPHTHEGRFLCSKYCRHQLELADRREKRRQSLLSSIECAGCGDALQPKRPNQRTHGAKCRQTAKRHREKTQRAAPRKTQAGGSRLASLYCVCDGAYSECDGDRTCVSCGKSKAPVSSALESSLQAIAA